MGAKVEKLKIKKQNDKAKFKNDIFFLHFYM